MLWLLLGCLVLLWTFFFPGTIMWSHQTGQVVYHVKGMSFTTWKAQYGDIAPSRFWAITGTYQKDVDAVNVLDGTSIKTSVLTFSLLGVTWSRLVLPESVMVEQPPEETQ